MIKFSLMKQDWMKCLTAAVNVTDRKQIMPILSFLKIEKKGEILQVIGTDLETEIQVAIEHGKGGEDFTVLLPGKTFYNICSLSAEGQEIILEIEGNKVAVKAQSSNYNLLGMDPAAFPIHRENVGEYQWETKIKRGQFRSLLQRSSFAADEQNVRQYLNGVMFTLDCAQIIAIATDTHRLAFAKLADLVCDLTEKQSFILPKRVAQELQRLLNEEDEQELCLQVGNKALKITTGQLVIYTKLISGSFPEYQKIIPAVRKNGITIETSLLTQAINKVGILVDDKLKLVKLSFTEQQLTIDSNTENQGASDIIDIEYQGEAVVILINLEYLRETLRQITAKEVKVYFKDAKQAVIFEPQGEQETLYLIMPVVS